MRSASEAKEILQFLDTIRAKATSLQTNLYADEAKLGSWISEGPIEYFPTGVSLFLLRKDRGFWHLYFCSPSAQALASDLAGLSDLKGQLTTDLVGLATQTEALESALAYYDFMRYASLRRLVLVPTLEERSVLVSNGDRAEPAIASDLVRISQLLEQSFDPLKEQIPFKRELARAIEEGRIIVVRDEACIAGLLYYETIGMTSTLRYWLVCDGFRNSGVGSVLMSTYIGRCPDVRRFILWVLDDNSDAISKYRHYGFKDNSLIDIIMTRKGEGRK